MDAERRQRLEQRREKLREELAARERIDSVRFRTELLDELDVAYELVLDDQELLEWVWRHFPMGGGLLSPRIDWTRVETTERGPDPLAADGAARDWLRRLGSRVATGGCDVVLLTGNALNPGIRVAWADVVAHPRVTASDVELWVVCAAQRWIIEYTPYHEGWWWGRAESG